MLAVRTLPAITALLLITSIPTAVAAQSVDADDTSLLTVQGDVFVLSLDQEDGTPLIDLLALFGQLLQVPIAYQHESVVAVRVHIVGDVRVSREDLRVLLDDLVRAYGLVSWDAKEGDDALITIAAADAGSRQKMGGAGRRGHQVVPLARLDEQPPRISAVYTTVFPLRHVNARSVMSTFNPFVDTRGEMIRSVERSNSLLVTSFSMDTLREIRDLIALIDVESSALAAAVDTASLEKRINALEAQLADLEARVRSL